MSYTDTDHQDNAPNMFHETVLRLPNMDKARNTKLRSPQQYRIRTMPHRLLCHSHRVKRCHHDSVVSHRVSPPMWYCMGCHWCGFASYGVVRGVALWCQVGRGIV